MTIPDLLVAGYARTCLCGGRSAALSRLLTQTNALDGEVWECGVYRGGTVMLMTAWLRELGSSRTLRAFDTFAGMPTSGPLDTHLVGAFPVELGETEALLAPLGVCIHAGRMPATFAGLKGCVISLAHIDVDQYESVRDCLAFVYPRMQSGGVVVLDDYNCTGCPGAHKAVDEFMADKPETLRETTQTPQVWFQKA